MPVDWRRVRRPLTYLCFSMSLLGAVAASLGSMVAGRLADGPTSTLLTLLALCVVGGAVIDTVAKTIWATICDRAEGQLRADLLDAAMAQPLSELSEQAVGEVLDRIDDDTWEVGQLMRWGVWQAARTFLASGPLWVVASLTWWPAVFLFPLTAVVTYLSIRRLLPEIAQRKVVEDGNRVEVNIGPCVSSSVGSTATPRATSRMLHLALREVFRIGRRVLHP